MWCCGFTYILSNRRKGALYIGVTNDLQRRLFEHRHARKGFTSRYKVYRLVYFEEYHNIADAIAREKQLKRWHRAWKINLIESVNPGWRDLSEDWDLDGH